MQMQFSQLCATISEGCPLEYYSGGSEIQKKTQQLKMARGVHIDPRAPRLKGNEKIIQRPIRS